MLQDLWLVSFSMYRHVVRTNCSLFKDFFTIGVAQLSLVRGSQKTNSDQTPLNWTTKTFVCGLSWLNLKERFCFYHFKHFGPPNMPFSDCSQCWLLLALQVETALAVCSESVWILFLHLFLPVLLGFFLPNIDINKCNRSSAGQGVLLALNIFFSLWKRAVQRIGLGDNHLNAAGKNVKR